MTEKDIYLTFSPDEKKVIYLCVAKSFSFGDAVERIYGTRLSRIRQKVYEMRKRKAEAIVEKAKKGLLEIEVFAEADIPAQVPKEIQLRKKSLKILVKTHNEFFLYSKITSKPLTT